MQSRIKSLVGLLLLAALVLPSQAVFAASYPDRPVKMLVPLAPGSAIDIVARLIADKMSVSLGQSFFVEDQPGDGRRTGTSRVIRRSGARSLTHRSRDDCTLTAWRSRSDSSR